MNGDERQYTERIVEAPTPPRGATLVGPETAGENPFFDVIIQKVANGFIIRVGCKTFIAKTWVEASTGLAEYWENPQKAEKKYSA